MDDLDVRAPHGAERWSLMIWDWSREAIEDPLISDACRLLLSAGTCQSPENATISGTNHSSKDDLSVKFGEVILPQEWTTGPARPDRVPVTS
ncbi:hypothetical protein AB0M95_34160 [Sphaerisporangium sp. NPDC051017]|uniref:hypothetical protein n=1 Tax=Sphaerisporangium sp. NPDC051017 TaxID=3154636 RepID=UPI003425FDEA